jgi:L-amino acid N-acyltransferase YncA
LGRWAKSLKFKVRNAKRMDYSFIVGGLEDIRHHAGWLKRYTKATISDRMDIKKAILGRRIRVVEHNNRPIGFINFSTDSEIMYFQSKFVWVDLIYVRKMYRGKGVGALLYKDVCRIARTRGIKRVVVDVFEANKKSILFHKRLGFKRVYTIYQKKL